MIAFLVLAYVAIGSLIAYALNASFNLGGPVDPGASGSAIFPKWTIILAIVAFWPLAMLLPVIFVMAWIRNGSH